jgi:hypothetical protein
MRANERIVGILELNHSASAPMGAERWAASSEAGAPFVLKYAKAGTRIAIRSTTDEKVKVRPWDLQQYRASNGCC